MTKADFIARVAEKMNTSKAEAGRALQAVEDVFLESLTKGGEVKLLGGKFTVVERPSRIGRNPRTGEALQLKAKNTLRFEAQAGAKAVLEKLG